MSAQFACVFPLIFFMRRIELSQKQISQRIWAELDLDDKKKVDQAWF